MLSETVASALMRGETLRPWKCTLVDSLMRLSSSRNSVSPGRRRSTGGVKRPLYTAEVTDRPPIEARRGDGELGPELAAAALEFRRIAERFLDLGIVGCCTRRACRAIDEGRDEIAVRITICPFVLASVGVRSERSLRRGSRAVRECSRARSAATLPGRSGSVKIANRRPSGPTSETLAVWSNRYPALPVGRVVV